MLRKNQKGLQVWDHEKGWQWVFAHAPTQGIVTTELAWKALPASDLYFFKSKFGNNLFRAIAAKDI